MRKIIPVIAFMACISASKAQLKNSMWAGTLIIPTEVDVYLKFKTDTAQIILQENGNVGETMHYTVKDSIITFKKLSGNSPCKLNSFTVTYTVINNQLTIKSLSDQCIERVASWPIRPFDKAVFK